VGTDVYDRIYLAQLVREHLPDAQLFIVGRDVLYLHPAVAPALVGTWIVTADSKDGDALPSFVASGFHDAVRQQIDEDGCRFARELRILALGASGFHTLRTEKIESEALATFQGRRCNFTPAVSAGAAVGAQPLPASALPLLAASVAVLAALLASASARGRRWLHTLTRAVSDWIARSVSLRQLLRKPWMGLAACLVPALHLTLALALVWKRPASGESPFEQLIVALGALAVVALFILGFLVLLDRVGGAIGAGLAAAGAAFVFVLWQAADPAAQDRGQRALAVGSGLSPLVPLAFSGVALFVLLLQRARLAAIRSAFENVEGWATTTPWGGAVRRVRLHLGVEPGELPTLLPWLAAGVPLAGLVAWRWPSFPSTMEPAAVDWMLGGSLFLVALLATHAWVTLFQAWYALRPLLRALSASPFRDGFKTIPKELARTLGLRVYMRPLDGNQLAVHVERLASLASLRPSMVPYPHAAAAALRQEQASDRSEMPGYFSNASRHLSVAARTLISRLWEVPARDRPLAEQFIALEVTRFLSVVFVAIRGLAVSATVAVLLFFLAVSSYPFVPSRPLLTGALLGFAAGVTVILTVLFQSNRNELLSHITMSTPNRVDFDREFLLPFMTYAVVPLLVILSQFPGLDRAVQSILPWVR